MAGNRTYAIGDGWRGILAEVGVDYRDVLRRAGLPDDLLNRRDIRLSTDAFIRFFAALDTVVSDGAFWVRLTEAMSPEYFTPPMFAALCSPDLATATERLARFKPLMGPVHLQVRDDSEGLTLTYRWLPSALRLPAFMHGMEALFVTRLARLGTRLPIHPSAVTVPELPRDRQPFEDYLRVRLRRGEHIRVTFTPADAHRPFRTANRALWAVFEPELRRHLADLGGEATFAERTRAVLLEALPSGQGGIGDVARRLAVSASALSPRRPTSSPARPRAPDARPLGCSWARAPGW